MVKVIRLLLAEEEVNLIHLATWPLVCLTYNGSAAALLQYFMQRAAQEIVQLKHQRINRNKSALQQFG